MAEPARRATVRLLSACNNHCVFCAQHGSTRPALALAPDAWRAALVRARTESTELTLVGGEPTLAPDLAGVITAARAAGFARVGIQTNARRLAERGYADALADAGLTDVHVSIHGAAAAVHEYHTGAPCSFAQAFAGIGAARTRGLAVVATTVLTRSNFRVLANVPRLLRARGVAAWLLAVPRVAGRAGDTFDRVVPRLGLALPFALHALHAARTLGLPAWIAGAPLCALGPFATRTLPGDPPRAYAPQCDRCAARPACPGVDPAYLARFAGDELAPRAAPERATESTTSSAALARMFVGVGELVPPAARTALPVVREP